MSTANDNDSMPLAAPDSSEAQNKSTGAHPSDIMDSSPAEARPVEEEHFVTYRGKNAWLSNFDDTVFTIRLEDDTEDQDEGGEPPCHLLMTKNAYEEKLRSVSSSVKYEDGTVKGWDVACLGVNVPIEDAYAFDVLPMSGLSKLTADQLAGQSIWRVWTEVKKAVESVSEKADKGEPAGSQEDKLFMFSVIDGHGQNPSVAQLVRRALHPAIALRLATVSQEGAMQDESKVRQAISDAFVKLDNEILAAPNALLEEKSSTEIGGALTQGALIDLDTAGACVTTMIVDTANSKLHIANLGDCRAVAAWKRPDTEAWRCEVFSERGDQNPDNPAEMASILAQWPNEEGLVTGSGVQTRIVGCLVSGAMGDAYGKKPLKELQAMQEHFQLEYPTGRDELGLDNGPYFRSEPEVITRDLHPVSGEVLKSVAMFTDGISDNLSSEEVALLIAAKKYPGIVPALVPKSQLPQLVRFDHPEKLEARPYPVQALPGTTEANSEGTWTLKDDSPATTLLRNSTGRGNAELGRRLMSMRAEDGAREYRDDQTAVVIQFS